MQAGELVVVENGQISIPLDSHPSKLCVFFQDNWKMIPCNPVNYEELNYKVVLKPVNGIDHFQLELRWKVSSTRSIRWEAYY